MASTNKTTHYELSQYTANDKPTYLVDYNGDMSKIDTGIYEADTLAKTNESAIGTMSNLNTTDKSSLVGAINEVNTQVGTNTGNISTLNTSVSANTGNIGTMANLTTTNKTNLVSACNEINANIGDITLLNTQVKTDVVSAINELELNDIYTTSETYTGKKWIDGKKIYRIVIEGTINSTGNYQIIDNRNIIDTLIDCGGYITDSANNLKFMIGKSTYINGGDSSRIIQINNNARLDYHDNLRTETFKAVLEYTKVSE